MQTPIAGRDAVWPAGSVGTAPLPHTGCLRRVLLLLSLVTGNEGGSLSCHWQLLLFSVSPCSARSLCVSSLPLTGLVT